MNLNYSYLLDILLVVAFIIDRVFRLRSLREYKEAKEAQIENLKQQLENERRNNDIEITEMHKKRYENLKMLLDEREVELEGNKKGLLSLQAELSYAAKERGINENLNKKLLEELNKVEKGIHKLETEKKALEAQHGAITGPDPLRDLQSDQKEAIRKKHPLPVNRQRSGISAVSEV